MIKHLLFDNKVEVGISEINDGSMRFFGEGDEGEIIGNQNKLSGVIGLNGERVARVRTIYDGRDTFTDYGEVTDGNLSEYSINNPEERIPISDGLVTSFSEVGLLLPLADCVGAVVFDERQGIVGLLHSGRQNLEQYGSRKFIEYLVRNFGAKPEELKIYFSPYAVNYPIFKLGNKSMSESVVGQLMSAGVLLENIFDSKIDTVSDERFPSRSGGELRRRFAIVVKKVS